MSIDNVGTSRPQNVGVCHKTVVSQQPETFSTRLKRLREARGTQVVVAADIGISRAHLAKMETAKDMPGRDTLQALATYFNVTMDYLQCGGDAPPPDLSDDAEDRLDKLRMDQIWTSLGRPERKFLLSQLGGLARDNPKKGARRRGGQKR